MPTKATGGVVLLVLVGVIGLGGVWAVTATVDEVGTQIEINDTVNQTAEYQPVGPRGYDSYSEPNTVENSTGSINESQYDWNGTDGTIAFSYDNATENVTVDGVTARSLPDDSGAFVAIAAPLSRIPGWMAMLIAVGALLGGISQLNDLNNRRGGPL